MGDKMNSLTDVIYNEEENEQKDKKDKVSDALAEKFLKTRQIILSGQINKELAEKIVRQLLVLEADNHDPIYVYIDSPGGDVDAGFAIFDMIRFIDAPVYLIGMGLIASAAALILLAAPKERRLGLPDSRYLIHQPLSEMQGAATDIEIHALEMSKTKAKLNKLISDETGKPIEQVSKDTERDCWLSAKEAEEYGLISAIVSKRSDLKNI